MALVQQIALVAEIPDFPLAELMKVGAALQKQATRDLAPIWGVQATVDTYARLEDVPLGYWPIILVRDVPDAAGVHLDRDGQPYALVEFEPDWSLTASHECLEMLVDPFGDRLLAGRSPHPDQGRVEFLVEVCDPSEAAAYAYTVNGVTVSDFYTPAYFDPIAASGVRYSFGGHVRQPRTILDGGYVSWHDPVSDHWFQQTWFGSNEPEFRDLGVFSADDPRSLREIVDAKTPEVVRLPEVERRRSWQLMVASAGRTGDAAANARALRIRAQIGALVRKTQPPAASVAAVPSGSMSDGRWEK